MSEMGAPRLAEMDQLLRSGQRLTAQEIAEALVLSVRTVNQVLYVLRFYLPLRVERVKTGKRGAPRARYWLEGPCTRPSGTERKGITSDRACG